MNLKVIAIVAAVFISSVAALLTWRVENINSQTRWYNERTTVCTFTANSFEQDAGVTEVQLTCADGATFGPNDLIITNPAADQQYKIGDNLKCGVGDYVEPGFFGGTAHGTNVYRDCILE